MSPECKNVVFRFKATVVSLTIFSVYCAFVFVCPFESEQQLKRTRMGGSESIQDVSFQALRERITVAIPASFGIQIWVASCNTSRLVTPRDQQTLTHLQHDNFDILSRCPAALDFVDCFVTADGGSSVLASVWLLFAAGSRFYPVSWCGHAIASEVRESFGCRNVCAPPSLVAKPTELQS